MLAQKSFLKKKSEFENQINLIKYAPMTEIQTILTPPPLPHSFNEENSAKFENHKFGWRNKDFVSGKLIAFSRERY